MFVFGTIMPSPSSPDLSNDIYYWDGYIELEKTTRKVLSKNKRSPALYEQTIQKIIDHQWAALKPEKIGNTTPAILSVRMNGDDRLLVTTTIRNGKRCLLILEIILDHDYISSHFLQPGVLKDFMDANEDALWQKIPLTDEEAEHLLESPVSTEKLNFKPLEYYNQNFIQLDDTQQSASNKQLPLIVSALAGSGKSVVAFMMLATKRREMAEQSDKTPLLYITKSEVLAEEMQIKWNAYDVSNNPDLPPVFFKSYKDLASECPETEGKIILTDKNHYFIWQEKYLEQIKNQLKSSKKAQKQGIDSSPVNEALFTDVDKLYQEFRVMSELDKKEYLALGKRQSLFYNEIPAERLKNRKMLWKAFKSFKNSLPPNSLFLDFTPQSFPGKYSLVVADESQDFSGKELANLIAHFGNHLVCFIDTHQGLYDTLSKREKLKAIFRKNGIKPDKLKLTKAYRSPKSHLRAINVLFNMTYHLTGGIADKDEQAYIHPADDLIEGNFDWVDELSSDFLNQMNDQARSVNFAVICSATHHDEARSLFPFATILTVEESKGLEFETILIFRPLDEDIYKEACRALPSDVDFSVQPEEEVNRAVVGKGDTKFAPPLNHLVTAFSRSKNTMKIYQPRDRKLQKMREPLQGINKDAATRQEDHENKKSMPSSPEEWVTFAKKLYKNKNFMQASFILAQYLEKSKEEIEQIFDCWKNPQAHDASLSAHQINEVVPQVPDEQSISSPKSEEGSPRLVTRRRKNKKSRKLASKVNPPPAPTDRESRLKEKAELKKLLQAPKNTIDAEQKTIDAQLEALHLRQAGFDKLAPPKDEFEVKWQDYFRLLLTRRELTFVWQQIFQDDQFPVLLSRKVGTEQHSLLDKVLHHPNLAKGLFDCIEGCTGRILQVPGEFFAENLGKIIADKDSDLARLLILAFSFKPIFINVQYNGKPSILYQLSETQKGREFLHYTFQCLLDPPYNARQNPLRTIILEDLFLPQTSDLTKSIFVNLCEDKVGQTFILESLFFLKGWHTLDYDLHKVLFETTPSLPSLFTRLIAFRKGRKVIYSLMENKSNLSVPIEILRSKVPGTRDDSHLRYLAECNSEERLLCLIVKRVISELTACDLFTIHNNKSLFGYLLDQKSDFDTMYSLFSQRSDLLKHLTVGNLTEKMCWKVGQVYRFQPVLFRLLNTPEIRVYLSAYFEICPEIFNDLSLKDLISMDIDNTLLFENILDYSDRVAQSFMNSKNAVQLFRTINRQTKEPYIYKRLRTYDMKMVKIILSCPALEPMDFAQDTKTNHSLESLACWRTDGEAFLKEVKQRSRSLEKKSGAISVGQRNTFFGNNNTQTSVEPPAPKKKSKKKSKGKRKENNQDKSQSFAM